MPSLLVDGPFEVPQYPFECLPMVLARVVRISSADPDGQGDVGSREVGEMEESAEERAVRCRCHGSPRFSGNRSHLLCQCHAGIGRGPD